MARVRSRDTAPELALRKALWARNKRYRIEAGLAGRPDLVFTKARLAVFVDGCFWHGCPEHYTAPVGNSAFWRAKLERNRARDKRVDRQLENDGWAVLRLWEHQIWDSLDECVSAVIGELEVRLRCREDSGDGGSTTGAGL